MRYTYKSLIDPSAQLHANCRKAGVAVREMITLFANQEHSAEQVRTAMQQLSAIELQVLRATGTSPVRFLQEKQRRERD